MAKLFVLVILILFGLNHVSYSQYNNSSEEKYKPSIDLNSITEWSYLAPETAGISNTGKYIFYSIRSYGGSTTICQSTDRSFSKEFKSNEEVSITKDESKIIFGRSDTLFFLNLSNYETTYESGIISWQVSSMSSAEWIIYLNQNSELCLYSFITGVKSIYKNVTNYKVLASEEEILVQTEDSLESTGTKLKFITIKNNVNRLILKTPKKTILTEFASNKESKLVVFSLADSMGNTSIWSYKDGMNEAEKKLDNASAFTQLKGKIDGPLSLSLNGKWIFFYLSYGKSTDSVDNALPKVEIWSYFDKIINPEQVRLNSNKTGKYLACISTDGNRIVQLEDSVYTTQGDFNSSNSDYIIVSANLSTPYWWPGNSKSSFYLLYLKDGIKTKIPFNPQFDGVNYFSFSPTGRFLIYFDRKKRNYFSYDFKDKRIRNISSSVPHSLCDIDIAKIYSAPITAVAGWEDNDSSLLVYDEYDIWMLDPLNLKNPRNLTNFYGRKKRLKLRLVNGPATMQDQTHIIYCKEDTFLLTGFNFVNKFNGFLKKSAFGVEETKEMFTGPYTFFRVESQKGHYMAFSNGLKPIKAKTGNVYLICRQSATEAPNLYLTNDFRTFRQLTNINPQRLNNWLYTELINWRLPDGRLCQGVLYKPENFSPSKKYPIIIHFYEKMSHRLYEYPVLNYTHDNINIPWFVSNGYLVFTPDIYYSNANKSGLPVGEMAYRSIISGVQELLKFKYIDQTRIGIQGHSFGAQETNYVICHSKLFAAAAEVAGSSDPVSNYLTLARAHVSFEHYDNQPKMELRHELYGASLWQRPDLYLRNSTVLNANQIITPLLIMHNKKDNQIPWNQGLELYMALRRLQKPSWMIQYDESSHYAHSGKDERDFTIRITQYFDHFLKGRMPPEWMTKGMPANLKGIELRYQLDNEGFCSHTCKTCIYNHRKVNVKNMHDALK